MDGGTRFSGREREQVAEVVRAGDLRPGHLVQGGYAECGGMRPGPALGGSPLAYGHVVVGGGPGRMVGLALAPAVPEPSPHAGCAAAGRERGRHDRAVAVDAGEVDGRAAGRAVKFGGCGRTGLGPGRLVPVGAEHDGGGVTPDMLGELVEGEGQGRRPGQVESVEGKPGRGHVHVGVHECGRDHGVVEVHDLLGRQGVGGRVRADPGDPAVLDQHRRRERGCRAVDPATAVEDAPPAVGFNRYGAHRLSVLSVQRASSPGYSRVRRHVRHT